jgi:cell wall assembly regulator SMI1
MSDGTVRDLWQRIERVLLEHVPDTAATLAPPATDQELDTLETTIGLKLPADLRASLRIHNGQNDSTRCHSFTVEGMFLGASEIARQWKMVTGIDEGERARGGPGYGRWWKTSCIPFTHSDGDMLCVDMDPELGDQIGEIVCHVHDSEIERGIAASFGDWLASVADRLDAGRFTVDEYGYLSLDFDNPPE